VSRYIQALTLVEQKKLQEDGAKAITYLMPVVKSAPRCLRGKHDTLAIRFTAHPIANQLCRGLRHALVSTSANISGMRPVKNYAQCRRQFASDVWVLPGQVGHRRQPSRILAWADGRVVRN
jgi:L-threonylcarbamoyladenylate synthase